ncbi:glycosyltransferase family 2 protein [Halomonas sp. B23F22_10]|uniref:glycosyltransferase family 2 protein n=1 Tax=Halomonas sp. B23F22_10 TaxID=3459515 RepID=UPI00373DF616
MPLVTVVMPVFNSEATVGEAIRSVTSQTFGDLELIVVDDGSTDGTLDIVESYSKNDPRVFWFRLDGNQGAAVARNTAIGKALGRYIAFLDSDDAWAPEKLERQVFFMRENSIELSYTAYSKVGENGEWLGHVGVPDKVTYHQLLKTCVIGCLTAMYDTKKLGKVYMPLVRKRQDYGLWLNILKLVPHAMGINEPLAFYRVRSDSISADKKKAAMHTWKLYREVEGLGKVRASYYFLNYSIRGVLRHHAPRLARVIGVMD